MAELVRDLVTPMQIFFRSRDGILLSVFYSNLLVDAPLCYGSRDALDSEMIEAVVYSPEVTG